MIGAHNDKGARCPKHYGSLHLVRCYACEGLNNEYSALGIEEPDDAA